MSEPTIWALALKAAPIWYGVVKEFLSERVAEAGKDLIEEGIQEGAKSGIIAAVDRLRDPEGKSFSEAFEKASKSFLARYELDRDLAKAVIGILHHAQEKQLHELNRDVLIATIFSDKPRVAPIERYCQRAIAFDQIVAGSAETYSIPEVSRAFRYFFEELQRELMLSEKWRDVVVQFRSLQLQAKIAGEFDPLEMRREYLAYLRDRYQFLDLKGFSPRVSGRIISLRLTEIFTDLQLEEGRPYVSEYAEDDLAMMSEKQFFELDWERQLDLLEKRYVRLEATKPKVQLLKLSDILTSRRVVILGDPGSGKTTLTRYLALVMASTDYSRTGWAVEGLLPVLVRVSNYGRALEKDPTLHLVDYICQELTSDFGPLLKQELEYGQCLVMLDGLDEVAEVGQRQRVAESIEDMVATYGRNRFLVTSRPIGYQSVQLAADFRHVTLRPLTEEEQEQFVRLWHKEIRARGAGKAEGAVWFEEPEALIKALKTKPSVAKLAGNPLLLTIIVLMYWHVSNPIKSYLKSPIKS
jgi:energy-coupling factor transporter ATP-binding protein EcfA2